MAKHGCSMCGACCYGEVPVTLLDIQRLSEYLGLEPSDAFGSAIDSSVSTRSGIFSLGKKPDRACIFLDGDRRCRVHAAKPTICRLYVCRQQRFESEMTQSPEQDRETAAMWEQAVAERMTRAYIDKNGTTWNEPDFKAAIDSLSSNILVRSSQTLKVGRDCNGHALGLIYDCSTCDSPGRHVQETPVTLDDVQRMAAFLHVTPETFFRGYLDSAPSRQTGGLKLLRDSRCTFFAEGNGTCQLDEARPKHCLFTPCPRQVSGGAAYDALYLGSGSVQDQFRHQAAMALTREYVSEHGTLFQPEAFRMSLDRLETMVADQAERERFFASLRPFRYREGAGSAEEGMAAGQGSVF